MNTNEKNEQSASSKTTGQKTTKTKSEGATAEIVTFGGSREERSDELLEQAQSARSSAKAIELAKQALKANPENIEAERFLLEFENDDLVRIRKLKDLIAKEETSLKKREIYTDESIGHFWGIWETRPLMRLKSDLAHTFIELGKRKEAISVYEEMLKLCPNDNIGVRFLLIGLYVFLEEYEKAEELFKEYNDNVSAFMLLPMAVCYYKKDDYEKAKSLWKTLIVQNKHIQKFLSQKISDAELEAMEDEINCYQLGSLEEAFLAYRDNIHLLASNASFVVWLAEQRLIK